MDAEEEWAPREVFDPGQFTSLSASNRGVATLPSEYGRERASSARRTTAREQVLRDLPLRLPELISQLPSRFHRHSTSERTHLVEQCSQLDNLGFLGNTPRLLRFAYVALHTSHFAESWPAVTALLRGW